MTMQQRTWPWVLATMLIACVTAYFIGQEETRQGLQIALWRGYEARVLEKAEIWR